MSPPAHGGVPTLPSPPHPAPLSRRGWARALFGKRYPKKGRALVTVARAEHTVSESAFRRQMTDARARSRRRSRP